MTRMISYPAILCPADVAGRIGCSVPDLLIHVTGRSQDAALTNAVDAAQELLTKRRRDGEAYPEPTPINQIERKEGLLVVLAMELSLQADLELIRSKDLARLNAETSQLIAETARLSAETARISGENFWIPFTVSATIFACALVATLTLLS